MLVLKCKQAGNSVVVECVISAACFFASLIVTVNKNTEIQANREMLCGLFPISL